MQQFSEEALSDFRWDIVYFLILSSFLALFVKGFLCRYVTGIFLKWIFVKCCSSFRLSLGTKNQRILFSKILGYLTVRSCYGRIRKNQHNFLASRSAVKFRWSGWVGGWCLVSGTYSTQEQCFGSGFIDSGSGSSILGWIPIRILFQIRIRFDWKNLQLKKEFDIFFYQKLQSLGPP